MIALRIRTVLAALVAAVVLAACGSESGSNGQGGVAAGTKLAAFTDKVRSCTPYLEEASPSEGTYDLSAWSGWDPGATRTVLGTLFDEGIGEDACIHKVVQTIDSHIGLVNTFSEQWGSAGTYTSGNMTATVVTDVPEFEIPFWGYELPILFDRLITLEDSSSGLTVHMAFAQYGGDNQIVVGQYTLKTAEAGVYIAQIQDGKVMISYAGLSETTGVKVQIMWEGNTDEETFKISVCTNAAGGNWEAMGGGGVSSSSEQIALMARNNATAQTYYIVLTKGELEEGRRVTIVSAATDPPASTGIESYISEESSACLGFFDTGDYPASLTDLAWE